MTSLVGVGKSVHPKIGLNLVEFPLIRTQAYGLLKVALQKT